MENVFLHSGKYGDFIYALWTIRALGGGKILFNSTQGSLFPECGYDFVKPLLDKLPYIAGASVIEFAEEFRNPHGQKMFCRQSPAMPGVLNLDNAWYWGCWGPGSATYHWIHRYAYSFGVTVDASSKVLDIPATPMERRPIVVQLTDRYRSIPDSAYKALLSRPDVVVIKDGSCKDMLEMATLIASSRFFVGNPSLGNALAQAMQHPRLIEHYHREPDAVPIGENGISFDNLDEGLEAMCKKLEN